jgi:hypothetical protein
VLPAEGFEVSRGWVFLEFAYGLITEADAAAGKLHGLARLLAGLPLLSGTGDSLAIVAEALA